jgi:hypothetical protein
VFWKHHLSKVENDIALSNTEGSITGGRQRFKHYFVGFDNNTSTGATSALYFCLR